MKIDEIVLIEIPCGPGWLVRQNKLVKLDPDHAEITVEGIPSGITVWDLYFVQDLFQAITIDQSQILDIGWYPDGAHDGQFKLRLVQMNADTGQYDWEKPLAMLQTRSIDELVRSIENILLKERS